MPATLLASLGDGRAFRERAEHRADLNVGPSATPRRSDVALVELHGNRIVARNASPLDLLYNRQHIGCKLSRICLYSGRATFRGLGELRIA